MSHAGVFDKKRYIQSKLDYTATGKATCPFHAITETFRMRRLYGWSKSVDLYHPDWFEEQFIAQSIRERSLITKERRIDQDGRNEMMCLSKRQLAIQAGRLEHFINRHYPQYKTYVVLVSTDSTQNMICEDAEHKNRIIFISHLRDLNTSCRGLTNVSFDDYSEDKNPVTCGMRIHTTGKSQLIPIYPDTRYTEIPHEELIGHVNTYRELRKKF